VPALSLTKKDFVLETFAAGGPGGQHQNTTNTAVRIRHPASGAVGESREYRSQHQNRVAALHRLVETKQFQVWKDKQLWGQKEPPEVRVERDMDPSNLLIMAKEDGKWKIID